MDTETVEEASPELPQEPQVEELTIEQYIASLESDLRQCKALLTSYHEFCQQKAYYSYKDGEHGQALRKRYDALHIPPG